MEFTILVDSREKEPFSFECATRRQCLEAGDYSVLGHERAVAVERKSLRDFACTVIHNAERFANELAKLSGYKAACIVVEADLDRVLRGQHGAELRGISPQSLLGAALNIQLRYRIPVIWCGSRPAARCFTENFLRMFMRAG